MRNKTHVNNRSLKMLASWKEETPTIESFGEVTLSDIESAYNDMLAAESSLAQSKAAVDQDRIRYNEAGAVVLEMQRKVYLGVIAQLGEDAPILKSMGYVRKSERKSGLTRRNNSDVNLPEPDSDLDVSEN
jgi:hypothetical protein